MSGLNSSRSAVPRACGGTTTGAEDGKDVLRFIEEDLTLAEVEAR